MRLITNDEVALVAGGENIILPDGSEKGFVIVVSAEKFLESGGAGDGGGGSGTISAYETKPTSIYDEGQYI